MAQDQNDAPVEKGDPTAQSGDGLQRRSYLKLLGVGATVGAGVSVAGRASAAVTRHGISFDTTYDAVTDLGMDPNGNDPVDAAVEQAFADNALVEMPPGEYLVGGTVQTSGTAGFVGTGSSREDARFTVPSGTAGATFVFEDGEGLFENLSFDQGTDWDKLISLVMRGGSWQYRSVACLGTEPNAAVMGDAVTSFLQTGNAGGISLLVDDLRKTGPADIRDYPEGRNVVITGHGTDVTIRNSDIRNSTVGSGLYLNNTSGEILVENNYFENCAHTAIRVNGANATVRNNAVVVDPFGEYGDPDNRWNSTQFDNGQWPMRGIWVYDPEDRTSGDAVLENNHVYHGTGNLIGCVIVDETAGGVTTNGSRIKSDPGGTLLSAASPADVTGAAFTGEGSVGGSGLISDSCVASSVSLSMSTDNVTRDSCSQPQIVRGEPPGGDGSDGSDGSGGSGDTDLPNTLTIQGMGTETNYEFTVSDQLQANEADGPLEEWDEISGSSANGWVTTTEQVDSFEFSGEVTDFGFLEGRAAVYLNGDRVDPATLSTIPRTLAVEAVDSTASYEFSVSGDLEAAVADGTESQDSLSGSAATGTVSSSESLDTYRFSGEVSEFTLTDGSATVYVDGQEVDFTEFPHTITIQGTGTATNYEFTVSGDLSENAEAGELEPWDSISGSTAEGWVTEPTQVDSFGFSGEVTDFQFLEGSATVYLDGREVDPATLGEPTVHTLTITGEGTPTNYEFTVSGDLSENAEAGELEPWDSISGSTAEGWVTEPTQVDGFEFTGEVTDFQFLEGSAAVTLDGESVDPSQQF